MQVKFPTDRIPGPRPWPLLGWRGNRLSFFRDQIGYMTALRRDYGDIVAAVRGGNGGFFTVNDRCPGTFFAFGPTYNRLIFTNQDLFYAVPIIGRVDPTSTTDPRRSVIRRVGTGLFDLNGAEHEQKRRLMMPAFHKTRVEAYQDDVIAATDRMLNDWAIGQRRNILDDMMQLTSQVASKTLFGLDPAAGDNSIDSVTRRWLKLASSMPVFMAQIDLPWMPYRNFLNVSAELDDALRYAIASKRAQVTRQEDILSVLIRARDEGSELTDEELVGHANILFIAGHDSTANAITWTLFLLSQHPEIMEDLIDEVDGNLSGDKPMAGQLQNLTLLDNVTKESLRLLPPVPMSVRVATEALEMGPYRIPQWSEVMFSMYHTHHDPELYSKPDNFVPDRWDTIRPSPYEYLPFIAGKRACIGAAFAMMEIKIVVAMLLQRYHLELAPDAKVDYCMSTIMYPKHGLPMLIRPNSERYLPKNNVVRGNVTRLVKLPTAVTPGRR